MNTDFGSIFSTLLAGANAKLEPQEGCKVEDGLVVKVGFGKVWKQSLTELSGGQRSLVALSLVLSLLRFKPAPIYILDEVDAALDLSHTQERVGPRPRPYVGAQVENVVCSHLLLAEHWRHDPHAFQAVAVSCRLPQGGHVQQRQRALPHEVRRWCLDGLPHGLPFAVPCLPRRCLVSDACSVRKQVPAMATARENEVKGKQQVAASRKALTAMN